jgi:hypothetical protein
LVIIHVKKRANKGMQEKTLGVDVILYIVDSEQIEAEKLVAGVGIEPTTFRL